MFPAVVKPAIRPADHRDDATQRLSACACGPDLQGSHAEEPQRLLPSDHGIPATSPCLPNRCLGRSKEVDGASSRIK
jgi:hypothetical protein